MFAHIALATSKYQDIRHNQVISKAVRKYIKIDFFIAIQKLMCRKNISVITQVKENE